MKANSTTNGLVLETKSQTGKLYLTDPVQKILLFLNPKELITLFLVSQASKQEAAKNCYWIKFIIQIPQLKSAIHTFYWNPDLRIREFKHFGKDWMSLYNTNMIQKIRERIVFLRKEINNCRDVAEKTKYEFEIKTLNSPGVALLIRRGIISLEFIAERQLKEMHRLSASDQIPILIKKFEQAAKADKRQLDIREAEINKGIMNIIETDPATPLDLNACYTYYPF